jgi:type IV pilus assembly protein PilC
MKFKCNVVDNGGKKFNKVYDATDEYSLLTVVKNDNMYLLEYKMTNEVRSKKKSLRNKDLIMFARQMGIMLDAGITVTRALKILEDRFAGVANEVYRNLYESIQVGNTFSRAMEDNGSFDEIFISMVDAGERSGTLEANLSKMGEYYEKQNKLNNKIKQALIYPIMLSVVTVIVVIFLVTMVVPTFVDMYAGHDLPWATQTLMNLSSFLTTNYIACIVVVLGIGFGYVYSRSIYSIRRWYDGNQLKIPLIGKLYKTIYSASCARSFASLYASGLGIVAIMEILAKVLPNVVIKERFVQVIKEIEEGSSISGSLKKVDIFDPMLISMIYIGEETGAMGKLLDKAADYFDEEADSATSQLVGILEPVIIIIMAVVVGFIIIAIMMPMYGMMQYV